MTVNLFSFFFIHSLLTNLFPLWLNRMVFFSANQSEKKKKTISLSQMCHFNGNDIYINTHNNNKFPFVCVCVFLPLIHCNLFGELIFYLLTIRLDSFLGFVVVVVVVVAAAIFPKYVCVCLQTHATHIFVGDWKCSFWLFDFFFSFSSPKHTQSGFNAKYGRRRGILSIATFFDYRKRCHQSWWLVEKPS